MPWLKALTEFGDIAVLVPLAALMLLWLLLMRSPRGVAWWVIAVAFCVSLTAILKISFYGCPPTPDLHSASGHTSFSTLVYGAIALVTTTESAGSRRIISISGSAGFILAIAVSCLILKLIVLRSRFGIGNRHIFIRGISAKAICGAERQGWLLSPLFFSSGAVLLLLHAENFMSNISSRSLSCFRSVAREVQHYGFATSGWFDKAIGQEDDP